MKKLFITLLIAPLIFASCNKKLKKEMDELEQEVAAQKAQSENLQAQNTNLQNQINNVNSLLGSNEPVTITTTFQDNSNITRNVSNVFSFKSSNYSTQYMQENGNGTYDVYIERFGDVEWEEGARLSFVYDPSNGAITSPYMTHYWSWNISGYNNYAYYSGGTPAPVINITLNKISTTTGEIDLTATASVVDGYNGAVPNAGKACSSTFSFKGTLGVMNNSF